MERPPHLPDFSTPPLDEVVLGIQFEPSPNYQQIRAGEVWAIFKDRYPLVEEREPLQPVFETFGLPGGPQFNFGVVTGAQHDRFWFLTEAQDELIQFQHDRLLHNWRKVGDKTNVYPRFENMIERFEREANALNSYFSQLSGRDIQVNQCEISYINIIKLGNRTGLGELSGWLNFIQPDPASSDEVNLVWRSILTAHGQPFGRLHCQVATMRNMKNEYAARVELTVRGVPPGPNVAAAIDFLTYGREMIVDTFTKMTTDSAHQTWGRVR